MPAAASNPVPYFRSLRATMKPPSTLRPSIALTAARRGGTVLVAMLVWFAVTATTMAAPLNPSDVVGPLGGEGSRYPELDQAIEKFNAGEFDVALDLMKKASANHPELPPALVIQAKMLLSTNQVQAAIGSLEEAVREDPSAPEPYLELGDLAFRQRRLTEAGLLFEKANEVTEQFNGNGERHKAARIRCHAGLAAVFETRENWDDALEHLQAWIELSPDDGGAHYRLGQTLFGLKKYEEAFKELEAGSKLNKDLPRPAITMGMLFERAGNRKKADEWMKYAVEVAPDDLRTRLGIARWHFQANELDQADQHARKACEIDPSSLDAKLLAGVTARYRKQYAEAERHFESAYLQSPSAFMASNQLALTLAEQDDAAKQKRALELAQLNARQYPQNPETGATLGWVYYRMKRLDDARRALQDAAQKGNVSADAAYYMAKIAGDQGRLPEARRLLQTALATGSPFAYRNEAEEWLAQLQQGGGN